MVFPAFEGDVRSARTPWLCAGLALLWVGLFATGSLEAEGFGLRPRGGAWPAGLAFFALHAGGVHLAVSLLWLGLAGPALEERWGRPCLALFLMLAIGGGAALSLRLDPEATRPLVGSSAGLAALVAAATLRFRRDAVRLRLGLAPRLSVGLRIPALALPVSWLAGVVLLRAADVSASASAGLDLRGQLAMVAAGSVFAAIVGITGLEPRWLRRRERTARERAIETHLARARQQLEADHPDAAYALLEAALDATPEPRVVEAFVRAAEACGRRGDALARSARAVADVWHGGRRELAASLWAPLVRSEPGLHLDTRLRLALAPVLGAAGLEREAALTLRGELRRERRNVTPGTALRIADAARTVHPDTAIEAARLALESDGLDAGKRARIEALIEELEADPRRLAAPELDRAEVAAPGGSEQAPAPADPEPADPRALALPEADDALELDTPRGGGRDDEGGDPRAPAPDPGESDPER